MKRLIVIFILIFTLTSCGTSNEGVTCNDDEQNIDGVCIKVEDECDGMVIDDECAILDQKQVDFYNALENTMNSQYYSLHITLTEGNQSVTLESYYEDNIAVHSFNNQTEVEIYKLLDGTCTLNDVEVDVNDCNFGSNYLFFKDLSPTYFSYSNDEYIFSSQYKDVFQQLLSTRLNNDSFEVFIITIEDELLDTLTITFVYGETRIKCDIEFTYYTESQLVKEGDAS